MKKLLWIGDGPDVPTGFGKATREVLNVLKESYAVTVLGINYRGDPGTVDYPVYAAYASGDTMGVFRLVWTCSRVQPDVIVVQNDGWNVPQYVQELRQRKPNGEYVYPQFAGIPIVAIVPIDGKNFQGGWLDGIAHTIFWSKFALDEARDGGYKGPASVVPLGVDLDVYHPMDQKEARRLRGLPAELENAFIVGNVNRNQSRKRWDLTIKYFAEWVCSHNLKTKPIYLYVHAAPTGDTTIHVDQLTKYYGDLYDFRFNSIVIDQPAHYGMSEEMMRLTYNCFDLAISTSQGEGFGLPALEAMACGVPCILPDWAAYSDWARSGAWLVPCSDTAIGQPYVNVIGGIADRKKFIEAMHALYFSEEGRMHNRQAALETANDSRYRWPAIGKQIDRVIDDVLHPPKIAAVPMMTHGTKDGWIDIPKREGVTA